MRKKTASLLTFLALTILCHAQEKEFTGSRLALSTNITDYLLLVSPNMDIQLAIDRQFTAEAGMKYNNWSFNHATDREVKNRQQTYYAGARWWPWYTFSGWWIGTALQYQEYDRGGLFRMDSEAGDAFGLSLSGGYSLQIVKWMNIDMGFGFWGGRTRYTVYECPYCGKKVDEGEKIFILPNEARLALQFIF